MPKKTIICLLVLAAVASAGSFTNVVVFGDSLSDNGNLYAVDGHLPGPPYYPGRVSNGPVAPEYVAQRLGVPLHDYAWAGATTGIGNINDGGTTAVPGAMGWPGMWTSFNDNMASFAPIAPQSLFILWGGPMDFLYPPPGENVATTLTNAVTNLVTMATILEDVLHAKAVLVPGMPDLGLTPRGLSLGPAMAAQLSALTDVFNATLKSNLPNGVIFFDTAALLRAMVNNGAAYGFTNVSTECFDGTAVCANPDQYIFWDGIHPTTRASEVVADAFLTAVPEPATVLLTGLALLLLGVRRKALR